MKVNVKCDKCEWRYEQQNIEDWYQKPCPVCAESIIINDDDMLMYNDLKKKLPLLEKIGFRPETAVDKNVKGLRFRLTFDSSQKKGC